MFDSSGFRRQDGTIAASDQHPGGEDLQHQPPCQAAPELRGCTGRGFAAIQSISQKYQSQNR